MKSLFLSILVLVPLSTAAGIAPLLDERYGADVLSFAEGAVIVGGSHERPIIEVLSWGDDESHLLALTPSVLLHSASVKLDEDHVLVTGGRYWMNTAHGHPFGTYGSDAAFVLDVATGAVLPTPPMSDVRSRHTATRLQNGSVLVAGGDAMMLGGFSYSRTVHGSVDLYAPDAGAVERVGSLLTPRAGHTATLLDDGRVLFVGGAIDPSAELYDPASGTSTPLAAHFARTNHTATRLPDGRVVIAGGGEMNSPQGLAVIEVFNPRTNTFDVVASDLVSRRNHAAVLLPDGRVLLAGGESDLVPLADVTLFDPSTRDVTLLAPLEFARRSPSAVVAPDGSVVILGGGVANAEIRSVSAPARRRPVRLR